MLIVVLSAAYLACYLPLLDRVPPVVVDEPWYANTAHNLASGLGLRNTNVGGRGGDQFFLYPLVVAGAFAAFGTTLWVGRFVSVIVGLIGLWGIGALCRTLGIRGWPLATVGTLFIISNVHYMLFRRLRPEALVITLSIWALYFFVEAWRTRHFSAALACAVLAGGSALVHPHGALLAVILGTLLVGKSLFDRRILHAVLGYAAGSAATLILFLIGWNFLQEQSLPSFLSELAVDSHRLSVGNRGILAAVHGNLLTFVPAYSLGLKRLYILLFEVGILVFGVTYCRRDRLAGLLSVIGLSWLLLGFTGLSPFYRWAFSVVIIFSLLVAGRLLSAGTGVMTAGAVKWLWVFTALYGLNTAAGDAYVLARNFGNTSYTRLTHVLHATIPDGVPVLTHLELWFAFQNNPVYTPFKRWSGTPYPGLTALLESGQIRYAVLSAGFGEEPSPTTGLRETFYVNPNDAFYRQAHSYVAAHGTRLTVLPTNAYGDIEVWTLPARDSTTTRHENASTTENRSAVAGH